MDFISFLISVTFLFQNSGELNNYNFVDGDILLPKETFHFPNAALIENSKYWKNGIVYYAFSKRKKHNANSKNLIRDSMTELSQMANIKFIEIDLNLVSNYQNYVIINNEAGCFSTVGAYQNGYVSLLDPEVPGAPSCMLKGVIKHELLHTLGFWHEQSRFDRDLYVKIFYENMNPQYAYAFAKQGPDSARVGSYDINSIMHYGSYYFSNNNRPTMLTIEGNEIKPNLNDLTEKDKDALINAYGKNRN